MQRIAQIVAVLLLAAIVVVTIAPLLSIQPTALRAARAAQLAMIALAGPATIVTSLYVPLSFRQSEHIGLGLFPTFSIVDVICVRLC